MFTKAKVLINYWTPINEGSYKMILVCPSASLEFSWITTCFFFLDGRQLKNLSHGAVLSEKSKYSHPKENFFFGGGEGGGGVGTSF